jgi:hypothetical protein
VPLYFFCTDKTIYEPFYAGFEEAGVYKLELKDLFLGNITIQISLK